MFDSEQYLQMRNIISELLQVITTKVINLTEKIKTENPHLQVRLNHFFPRMAVVINYVSKICVVALLLPCFYPF